MRLTTALYGALVLEFLSMAALSANVVLVDQTGQHWAEHALAHRHFVLVDTIGRRRAGAGYASRGQRSSPAGRSHGQCGEYHSSGVDDI